MAGPVDHAEDVELAEAARLLGVHYQTAYGWVRDGALRARKIGRAYRITHAELERFTAARSTAHPPPRLQVRDWAHQVERLGAALDTGDERAAREVIDRLVAGGVSSVEVCDELIAPVLHLVGERWAAGTLTIADEHRATAICERLLARLPNRRTRARGVAVVSAPAGEHHRLPSLMATIALRWDGWRVHHLAADMPTDELLAFLDREHADLLVLSTTMASAAATDAIRGADDRGIPVLTGRSGQRLAELLTAARPFAGPHGT